MVVSIIALLIGILLPAIGKARDQARLTLSQTNMRNLATAHETYAAEWADRQFTLIADKVTTKHELNTEIHRRFAEEGIEIPFPQRDLHLRSVPPELTPKPPPD